MYKDKNYGLPEDLLKTVKSVVSKQEQLESYDDNNEESKKEKPNKMQDRLPTNKQREEGKLRKAIENLNKLKLKEEKISSAFEKYLDENFHVEQLTEEEIQWIYENEFTQLDEKQSRTDAENQDIIKRGGTKTVNFREPSSGKTLPATKKIGINPITGAVEKKVLYKGKPGYNIVRPKEIDSSRISAQIDDTLGNNDPDSVVPTFSKAPDYHYRHLLNKERNGRDSGSANKANNEVPSTKNSARNPGDEEKKSWFGKALEYLPGYEKSRKNFAAKQKQLKGMSTLDAIGTTLKDFASRAPSALTAIPAGRVAGTAARTLVRARTAASAKPTGTNVAPRSGTSVKKPETGVKKNTGGQGGPIPLKSTNPPGSQNKNFDFGKARATAQTLKTPEQIAKTRKAMVAAGAAGAGGAIGTALYNKNDGPGSASAKPKKVTAKDRKDLFKGMPAGDPSFSATSVKPEKTTPGPGMPGFKDPTNATTPAPANTAKTPAKTPANTAKRRRTPSSSSSGKSWAQRQHSAYSTGGPSIFTPES